MPSAVAVTLCLASLTGCASTTYDETLAASATTAIATTTTLPVGTASELLARLRDEAADLAYQTLCAGVVNQAMERLVRRCPEQYLWGYHRYKAPRDAAPVPMSVS